LGGLGIMFALKAPNGFLCHYNAFLTTERDTVRDGLGNDFAFLASRPYKQTIFAHDFAGPC